MKKGGKCGNLEPKGLYTKEQTFMSWDRCNFSIGHLVAGVSTRCSGRTRCGTSVPKLEFRFCQVAAVH